jgi:hypothetical protein
MMGAGKLVFEQSVGTKGRERRKNMMHSQTKEALP